MSLFGFPASLNWVLPERLCFTLTDIAQINNQIMQLVFGSLISFLAIFRNFDYLAHEESLSSMKVL